MKDYKISKADQETIITFNPSDKMANIWTSDPIWMRKLEKLGGNNTGQSVEIDVPKGWIKLSQK